MSYSVGRMANFDGFDVMSSGSVPGALQLPNFGKQSCCVTPVPNLFKILVGMAGLAVLGVGARHLYDMTQRNDTQNGAEIEPIGQYHVLEGKAMGAPADTEDDGHAHVRFNLGVPLAVPSTPAGALPQAAGAADGAGNPERPGNPNWPGNSEKPIIKIEIDTSVVNPQAVVLRSAHDGQEWKKVPNGPITTLPQFDHSLPPVSADPTPDISELKIYDESSETPKSKERRISPEKGPHRCSTFFKNSRVRAFLALGVSGCVITGVALGCYFGLREKDSQGEGVQGADFSSLNCTAYENDTSPSMMEVLNSKINELISTCTSGVTAAVSAAYDSVTGFRNSTTHASTAGFTSDSSESSSISPMNLHNATQVLGTTPGQEKENSALEDLCQVVTDNLPFLSNIGEKPVKALYEMVCNVAENITTPSYISAGTTHLP